MRMSERSIWTQMRKRFDYFNKHRFFNISFAMTDLSICKNSPCKNSGRCDYNVDGSLKCICTYEWVGDTCESKFLKLNHLDNNFKIFLR